MSAAEMPTPLVRNTGHAQDTRGLAERVLDGLSDGLNAIGSVLIGLLTLMVCADVASRALFNQPVKGVPEMAALSIVAIVYLQISSSLKAGRWAVADLFLEKLGHRPKQLLQALYCVAGAAFFSLICVAVFPYVADAYQSDDYVGVPPLFTFPTWPVKALVLLGSAMCAVQFVFGALSHLRNSRSRP